MNYVAGFILTQCRNPEYSFWLFLSVCKVSRAIFDVTIERTVLLACYRHVLAENEPDISQHLMKYGVDPSLWVLSHFQSLFCRSALPMPYQEDIFEAYIASGDRRFEVLVTIGVAILASSRDLILASRDRQKLISILQSPPPVGNVDGERIIALAGCYIVKEEDRVELLRLTKI